jgi:hypothetical protein
VATGPQVSLGDVTIAAVAIIFGLALLLLPWLSAIGLLHVSGPGTVKAIQTDHKWLVIAAAGSAGVVLGALLFDITGAGRRILTRLAAVAALAFFGVKFGLDIHNVVKAGGVKELKYFGLAAWVGVVAVVALVVAALALSARSASTE